MQAHARAFSGAHEGENKNADKNHDEEKARSAPRMEARLHARVLHRERKSCFVAENGFMLRAVIHPHALHIRDHRAELEISEKDRKAENTLGKTAPYAERHEPVQKTREKRRQQGEKADGERDAEHDRGIENNLFRQFSPKNASGSRDQIYPARPARPPAAARRTRSSPLRR